METTKIGRCGSMTITLTMCQNDSEDLSQYRNQIGKHKPWQTRYALRRSVVLVIDLAR